MTINTLIKNTCDLQKVRILGYHNETLFDGLVSDFRTSHAKRTTLTTLKEWQFDFFTADKDILTIYI